jgi:GT2 family glycosyltransferase
MSTKIGVGIITCDRPDYLKGLLDSLSSTNIDCLYIINDGRPLKEHKFNIELNKNICLHEQTPQRQGVAKAKNRAIRYLINNNCDYIFLIEDDIHIKNKTIFEKYIEASKTTGIQHFNYGPGTPFNRKQNVHFDLHNRHTLEQESEPDPRLIIDYGEVKIALYTHVAGMLSFFTKQVIEKVGYFDERFYNAWEHVDHTYRIIKAGYHPPFWWFADIENSHKYIGEAKEAINNSAIAKQSQEWIENVHKGRELYLQKHGHYPNQPPLSTKEEVILKLKKIQNG